MKLTQHAQKRSRQRGFSKQIIDIIMSQGRKKNAPGGAMKIFIGRRECQAVISELKRAIQVMDRAKDATMIIKDDRILTVYK
jgi:hypothetical protein